MAKFNISQYLFSTKEYQEAKAAFKEASHACIHSCKLTLLSKLGSSEVTIPSQFNPDRDQIHLNILKDTVKNSKSSKKTESNQLGSLETSLNQINSQLETKRILSKKVHWIKALEDLVTEEISPNIKKLMHEQVERKRKIAESLKKAKNDRLEQLEKLKSEETVEKTKKFEEVKQKNLIEAQKKAEERKKYMEGLKELKKVKKKKLLHEKLAEEFEMNVIQPEAERIAEALAMKHKIPVPSIEEIQEHIREYKKRLENRSVLRQSIDNTEVKKFPASKFWQHIKDEEQMSKELEKIKEAEKQDLMDRKKNYSNLVRQLYQPSLQDLKVEKSKLRQATPKKRRVMSMTPTLTRPEKSIKPILSPRVQKPKELPKLDYLENRRAARVKETEDILGKYYHSLDISSLEQAKKAEGKIKRAEIGIKGQFNLEAEEKLTKVLIDSIKVKLEALNKP